MVLITSPSAVEATEGGECRSSIRKGAFPSRSRSHTRTGRSSLPKAMTGRPASHRPPPQPHHWPAARPPVAAQANTAGRHAQGESVVQGCGQRGDRSLRAVAEATAGGLGAGVAWPGPAGRARQRGRRWPQSLSATPAPTASWPTRCAPGCETRATSPSMIEGLGTLRPPHRPCLHPGTASPVLHYGLCLSSAEPSSMTVIGARNPKMSSYSGQKAKHGPNLPQGV